MSTSGLLDEQTKTSLGFITPVGGVSQITAGSGISLSPSGGTGVVEVSTTIQPPIIVDYRQNIAQNYNSLAPFPTYASVSPFSAAYTPPVNGYLQFNVSGCASHGSTPVNTVLFNLALVINGVQIGGFDNALMSGTTQAIQPAKANMAFSFPFPVVGGTTYTMSLVASQLGSDGSDNLTNMSWMITFFPTTPIPVPVVLMSAPLEDAPTVEEETVAEVAPSAPIENQTQVYWA